MIVALAIGASYELLESWRALATGTGATAFLGTQGDPWDTHMFMAFVGALASLLLLSRVHDRQLARPRSAKRSFLASNL